ncbi:META domain-containing protein [Helicobacter sp. 13S00477-4]|uniref:META domain-containing protein n=1 Tax=Helicobacter sp. 13S00477-4 TaxID=1905759 RepID=UPI000BA7B58A|nr:META domain-containing protein [Helicobacter sp. 13S00477-4]PAF50522.1 hypothetical protein BKH44_07755 [Helicobacter sp. 13S00477-4]
MKFFVLGLALFLSGCSLWNMVGGNMLRTNWEIEKIVVDGKEYLSPQSLKAQAISVLEAKEKNTQDNSFDNYLPEANPQENTALPQSEDMPQNPNKEAIKENEFLSIKEVATMVFDQTQNRIYGTAACNTYFASYTWKDTKHLEVGNTGMTRKLCDPDELMGFEFRFMRNFNGMFTVTQDKTSMILDNGKMQIYLQ